MNNDDQFDRWMRQRLGDEMTKAVENTDQRTFGQHEKHPDAVLAGPSRGRGWTPYLAAAAVVILLAVGTVLTVERSHSDRSTGNAIAAAASKTDLATSPAHVSQEPRAATTMETTVVPTFTSDTLRPTSLQPPATTQPMTTAAVTYSQDPTAPTKISAAAQAAITQWSASHSVTTHNPIDADFPAPVEAIVASWAHAGSANQLDVNFSAGTCGQRYDVYVVEASAAVVIGIGQEPLPKRSTTIDGKTMPIGCAGDARSATISLILRAPLGQRTIIDLSTGNVVPATP